MKLVSIVVALAVGILIAEGARIKTQVELAELDNQEAVAMNAVAGDEASHNAGMPGCPDALAGCKEWAESGQCANLAAICPCACLKQFQEAMDSANEAVDEAAANLNDPEFQKTMKTIAEKGLANVQAYAESAAQAVVDPRVQKQYKDEALKGLADYRKAIEQASAALKDPKLREAALENLKQAQGVACTLENLKHAQAAADNANSPAANDLRDANSPAEIQIWYLKRAASCKEVAANLNDPELQKKMKEIGVFQALANEQAAVDNAAKALVDPEVQKQFEHMALKAIAYSREAAEQAIAALTDPKLREAALETLKQVQAQIHAEQAAAEQAAAAAAEQLQKVTDQAEDIQKAIQKAIAEDKKKGHGGGHSKIAMSKGPGEVGAGGAGIRKGPSVVVAGAGESREEQLRKLEKALKDGVSPAAIVKIMSKEKQDTLANAPDFMLNYTSPALVVLKKEILRQRAGAKADEGEKKEEITQAATSWSPWR